MDVDKYSRKKHTEERAIRNALEGFVDLYELVATRKFKSIIKHDLLTDFAFGVDERLGYVRGEMDKLRKKQL